MQYFRRGEEKGGNTPRREPKADAASDVLTRGWENRDRNNIRHRHALRRRRLRRARKRRAKRQKFKNTLRVLFNVALHDMGNHSKFSDAWIEPIEKARRCRNRQTRRRVRQGKRPRRAVPAFRARSPPRRPTTVRRRGRSEETARIPSASRQLPLVLRLPCNPSRRLVARSRNVGIERNAGVHAVHKRVEPIPKIVFVLKGIDFLPVLKGGDSLNHAVSWFKGGSH